MSWASASRRCRPKWEHVPVSGSPFNPAYSRSVPLRYAAPLCRRSVNTGTIQKGAAGCRQAANSLRPSTFDMLRIKSVTLKGFKTFAQPTEFSLGSGITAIVGPNGCGKSNVADAIRWCLGEQSFGLLRSKKTVDVIFSGSDKRARQGMAAVSIILDNEAGELNIDFNEVEITRRAYRDGDNEYLVNGQKVRLQDITQLLGPSGLGRRAYAVIGQGLIDRVLSLRPEERRALFEEAAGITGYQQKRHAALRRLSATQLNLDRVRDVLAELSPRLTSLKRQADRALERLQIETDLKDLLRVWYGFQWNQTLSELTQAKQKAEQDRISTQTRRERLDEVHARLDDLRLRQTRLRAEQGERNQISDARHRRTAEVIRCLAVSQERLKQVAARQEDLGAEEFRLQAEKEAVRQRLEEMRVELVQAQGRRDSCQQTLDRLQFQLAERERQRNAAQERAREAAAAARKAENRFAEHRSRLEQLDERRAALKERLAQHQDDIRQRAAAAEKAASDLTALEAENAARASKIDSVHAEIQALAESIEAANVTLRTVEEEWNRDRRDVERIQTRLDLLQPVRGPGNVYASAVRSILQASEQGRLHGILGTVASRIQVPARLERAIEVALGAALQNVIAATWQDAQGAIEFLTSAGAGRATFLPLDRLRSRGPIPAPSSNGILGNAARSVRYDSEVSPAVHHLLQRVWIASDLAAARHALDQHARISRNGRRPAGLASSHVALPTVVTLEGEIIRPGGAVTGGSDGSRQRRSALAWEREARELPAELDRARSEARRAKERTQAARLEVEGLARTRADLEKRRQRLLGGVQRQQAALERARLRAARAEQEAAWHLRGLEQTSSELAVLDTKEEQIRAALKESAATLADAREQAALAERAAQTSPDGMLRQLADLRAEAAVAQENLKNRRALEADKRRTLIQIDSQLQRLSDRQTQLIEEADRLRRDIGRATAEESELNAEGDAHRRKITELESDLKQLDGDLARAEEEERAGQQLVLQTESDWTASRLALQRTEDRLQSLRREIRQDFGLADMEEAAGLAYQPPLPLQALVAQLPVVHELPAGLKDDVRETRARVRRLSGVNPDAPREYEEVAGRFRFLQAQSDDLERAARDLQQVISELDNRMEGDLRRTFEAVSTEFAGFFKLLLQGGTAQLSMTEPADILNTGIEIFARLPGKRTQSLDLLSGGERSLTACALVFAILRVSPTPFCVLDEVDATLDEANVDRLRSAMDLLRERTQFIVITHNRRTLEIADGIFGITMGDDGVSRVISLRLEKDELQAIGVDEPGPEPAVAM